MESFSRIFILVICLMSHSCSSGSFVSNWDPIEDDPFRDVRLLYISSVNIPDRIEEYTPFLIELHLSSELAPMQLKGFNYMQLVWYGNVTSSGRVLDFPIRLSGWYWVESPTFSDSIDLIEKVRMPFAGLPAGEYELAVDSADSQDWGGLVVQARVGNHVPPIHPHATQQHYTIVVQPKAQ